MAESITSVNNDIVKLAASLEQKKFRDETGLFLLEGEKPIQEALKFGIKIDKIFSLKETDFEAKEKYLATETVLKKIATTQTPPEIVAIARKKEYEIEKLNGKTILLLENIKDPGNLGAIIRTATGLGVHLIILSGACVDVYNPKVIRAATGNLFQIPIAKCSDFAQIRHQFRNHKFIGTILDEDKFPINLNRVNFNMPILVMFGSEAEGLSQDAISYVDEFVKIPLHNEVESLNIAISAAIVLYEATTH